MAIWANIQQTVTLLIILSILVVAHEWGHFIVARLCGIRVDDFSIGFGKRLFRIGKRGDTEYNVRMLPLGGFVKIAGMEPDEAPLTHAKDRVLGQSTNSDPDAGEIPLLAENLGEHTPYTGPDGFYSKPLWQRSLVILAGPVMSFVLGYVLFCLMGVTTGIPTGNTLNKVALTSPGGEGQRIGLRIGDVITSINGQPVTSGEQMIDLIHNSVNKPITLTVRRGDETFTRTAMPKPMLDDNKKPVLSVDTVTPGVLSALGLLPGDKIAQVNGTDISSAAQAQTLLSQDPGRPADITVLRLGSEKHLTGVMPSVLARNAPTWREQPIGLLNIFPAQEIKRVGLRRSFEFGNKMIAGTFSELASLIHRHEVRKAAGGIIYMYQATGLAVKSGLPDVVSMMASLSISLAIFNLLPIPVLDGGHLLTFFIEWVRGGKRLTDQQQQAFLMTGLAIIGVLFVLIMSNDIIRTVTHQLPQ